MKHNISSSIVSPISLFGRSKTVFRNFLIIASLFFTLLLASTIVIYFYARNIIQSELIHTNENAARNVAQSVDSLVEDMRYVTVSLASSKMVSFYFESSNASYLFEGFTERITEQLNAYVQGFEYIHSIYVYSPKNNSCISSYGEKTIATFTDRNWLEFLSEMEGKNAFLVRKVDNSYPFVLSLIHHSQSEAGEGYIILNLNLRKLPNVMESDVISSVYIITDEGKVLYRKNQEDILEPLSISSDLADYQPSDAIFSSFTEGSNPFIYTQMPSEYYPWSYITVTYMQEYTPQLTHLRHTLIFAFFVLFMIFTAMAFLLSVGSYRPILKLLHLLNDPANWSAAQNMNEQDIKTIVQQITTYVQTNTQLSDELQTRLATLKSTQLVALQTQINPHFMINTLNLIHCSIVKSLGFQHLSANMTLSLGRFLNYALDTNFLVTMNDEFLHTEYYLSILKARYPDKIQFQTVIEPDTVQVKVPKLLLQPMIENSLYHGVERSLDFDLHITIKSELCRQIPADVKQTGMNPVLITIQDDGVGMSLEKVEELNLQLQQDIVFQSSHIGLKNVAARLRLLYGDYCQIKISSEKGAGTCVSILLIADKVTVSIAP